jgi:hypothetical protein
MKSEPETSQEYKNFKSLLDRVMSVPHEEIMRREAEYKKQSGANPNKRGPKPKGKRASKHERH